MAIVPLFFGLAGEAATYNPLFLIVMAIVSAIFCPHTGQKFPFSILVPQFEQYIVFSFQLSRLFAEFYAVIVKLDAACGFVIIIYHVKGFFLSFPGLIINQIDDILFGIYRITAHFEISGGRR